MSETILLVEIPDPPSVPDHHGMRNLGARTHQRDIAHEEPHAMIIDCPAPAKRRQPLFLTNGQCVGRANQRSPAKKRPPYGRAELRANRAVRRLAQSPGGLSNITPKGKHFLNISINFVVHGSRIN